LSVKRLSPWVGLALPLLAGLLFWLSPLGNGLTGLSYDLLFFFKPTIQPQELIIVYLDEKSFRELGQSPENWDRSLHARLLDRLTKDEARLVVFDVWFTDPGTKEANDQLREAMKKNGRVVLAALRSSESRPGLSQTTLLKPLPEFLEVAAGWGVAGVVPDQDSIVRQGCPDTEERPSLARAAAAAAGARTRPRTSVYWLNFYGPQGTIPSVSYCDVTNQPPGYFRDKAVVVGARPKTLYAFAQADEFRTPHGRWGGAAFPGVEILATEYLNLVRQETLRRLSPWIEVLAVVACGLLLGWGAKRLKLKPAMALASALGLVIFVLAIVLQWGNQIWFSWMTVVAIQIPVALGWKCFGYLAQARPAPDLSEFLSADGKRRIPNIPDHVLLRRIGVGGYGEVWLARNTIGLYRAVKFIFSTRYASAEPYEREFRGIENYMPVSLEEPCLLHVLHLGRNDRGRYFFYIMEAGDDEVRGQKIDVASYSPRNLSVELKRRGRLPAPECVTLGLQLALGMHALHRRGLIHRDIKPSNILFVDGMPKLADIGLVAEFASDGQVSSFVGTEGYISPEGAGTAAGDIYSLGKVLYEAAMGRGRREYPDLPTSVLEGHADPGLLPLNEVILKCCESDPKQRYQSAIELHAALMRVQQRDTKHTDEPHQVS